MDWTRPVFSSLSAATADTEFSEVFPLPVFSVPSLTDGFPLSLLTPLRETVTVPVCRTIVETANRAIEVLNTLFAGPKATPRILRTQALSTAKASSLSHILTLSSKAVSLLQWESGGLSLDTPREPDVANPVAGNSSSYPEEKDTHHVGEYFNTQGVHTVPFHLEKDDSPLSDSLTPPFELLDADRVALPGPGEGGRTMLLDILPPDLATLFSDPSNCLRDPPPSVDEINRIRCTRGVKKGHYGRIIQKLIEANMCALVSDRPKCVNGLFAVPKTDGTQRLIFSGRRANLWLADPPPCSLLSPTALVDILLSKGAQLFVAKSDVRNMYHCIQVPEWMYTYLGLPRLNLSEIFPGTSVSGWVYPCVTSLPMGIACAVALASGSHRRILTLALPTQQLFVGRHALIRLSEPSDSATLEYIDDHAHLTLVPAVGRALLTSSCAALGEAKLLDNPNKREWPGDKLCSSLLGLSVFRDGWVGPGERHLRHLVHTTRSMISTGKTTVLNLQRVIGNWIWSLMLSRPLLSILQETFKEIASCTDNTRKVYIDNTHSPEVFHELQLLLDCIPFLFVDLHVDLADIALATDASLSGGGVTCACLSPESADQLFRHRVTKGWTELVHTEEEGDGDMHGATDLPTRRHCVFAPDVATIVATSRWTTLISNRWTFPDRIHILEGQSLILGLRWLARQSKRHGSRVPILLDSSCLLGAAAKGRSSSHRLNVSILRRVAALTCAADIRPCYLWVPSAHNPADAPSRQYECHDGR